MRRTAAVIGCGKARDGKEGWAIGHAHAQGWRAADPDIRLLGVDVCRENLSAFGEKFHISSSDLFLSTEALYASVVPDFVSVCTWPALHGVQVVEAAEHGVKGIACEKPAAVDPGVVRHMLATCNAAGTRLAIAHQRRHLPGFQLLKKILHEGRIGRPWVLEARVADGWDILSWTTHWFDMANFLFDARPLSILAGVQHSRNRRYQQAIEDESVIFVTYPERHQAVFITGPQNFLGSSFSIRGSEGLATIRGDTDSSVEIFSRQGFTVHQSEAQAADPFGAMLSELIAAVERGSPMACAARETAAATEMAYAAHESARTLRRIDFPVDFQYAPLEVLQRPSRLRMPSVRTVLYADSHFGCGGQDGLASALRDAGGGEVIVRDAAAEPLGAESLKDAALLVLYHTQSEPAAETRDALKNWVAANRPLLLVHAALGAYPQWNEYKKWCGRVWAWGESEHPHEDSKLLGRADWPWREAWLPSDEVFIKLETTASVLDLLDAEIPAGRYPAAWISSEFPHVGIWVPGHRGDLWRIPAMREGLCEMMRRITS